MNCNHGGLVLAVQATPTHAEQPQLPHQPIRRGRGGAAAIAPSKLRSSSVRSGRSTCRRSTPSWWRNTMIFEVLRAARAHSEANQRNQEAVHNAVHEVSIGPHRGRSTTTAEFPAPTPVLASSLADEGSSPMSRSRVRRFAAAVGAVVVAAAVVAVTASAPAVGQPGGFGDVAEDAYYSVPVSTLAEQGVFVGTECGAGFCPGDPIDRKTMAVWVVRVLDGEDPEAVSESRFDDVDVSGVLCAVHRAHGRARGHPRLRRRLRGSARTAA